MKFSAIKQPDGTIKVESVPIFKLGTHKGFDYTPEWFAQAQANALQFEQQDGYLPSVIIGHSDWDEKPEVAQFNNLQLAPDGVTVVADYLIDNEKVIPVISQYPHRSIEVYNEEAFISRVAQLGSSEPYHKLPPLKIAQFSAADNKPDQFVFDDGAEAVEFEAESELTIDDQLAQSDLNEESWKLDDALWSALRAIRDDESLSAEDKKARISERLNEWVGKKLNIESQKVDIVDPGSGADSMPEEGSAEFAALPPVVQNFIRESNTMRQQFTAQQLKLDEERDKAKFDRIKPAIDKLTAQGLALPIAERLHTMCGSLVYGQPAIRKDKPDGIVRFQQNSKSAQKPLLDYLLETLDKMAQAYAAGNLFAPLKPHDKPFPSETPEFNDSSQDSSLLKNAAADAEIRRVMKERGLGPEKYAAVQQELVRAGKITIE